MNEASRPRPELSSVLIAGTGQPNGVAVTVEDESPPPPSILNRRALHVLLRREVSAQRAHEGSARRRGPFPRPDAEKVEGRYAGVVAAVRKVSEGKKGEEK